jgi:hypothetical protein
LYKEFFQSFFTVESVAGVTIPLRGGSAFIQADEALRLFDAVAFGDLAQDDPETVEG